MTPNMAIELAEIRHNTEELLLAHYLNVAPAVGEVALSTEAKKTQKQRLAGVAGLISQLPGYKFTSHDGDGSANGYVNGLKVVSEKKPDAPVGVAIQICGDACDANDFGKINSVVIHWIDLNPGKSGNNEFLRTQSIRNDELDNADPEKRASAELVLVGLEEAAKSLVDYFALEQQPA